MTKPAKRNDLTEVIARAVLVAIAVWLLWLGVATVLTSVVAPSTTSPLPACPATATAAPAADRN